MCEYHRSIRVPEFAIRYNLIGHYNQKYKHRAMDWHRINGTSRKI
jgi:hypothetical protein